MASVQIILDAAQIGALLKSAAVGAVLDPFAAAIAANVRASHRGADVVVDSYVTDRAARSVTVRDRRAMGWQARDGLLTRAASAARLEVRAR
jgi:hypothetical protein